MDGVLNGAVIGQGINRKSDVKFGDCFILGFLFTYFKHSVIIILYYVLFKRGGKI